MKFDTNGRNGHTKDWSDLNHNGEHKKLQHGRVAYITVQVGQQEEKEEINPGYNLIVV